MPPSTWVWVFIPLAAILMRGFREFIRFKATQRSLGTSTSELERQVADLKKTNSQLVDRIESLEAIVVSQTWDAVNLPLSSETDRERRIASAAHREMAPPDPAEVNQQRVQQLAQRLGR